MQFKDQKKKSPVINITSLIDVMFILLIFFMVSSSFIEQPGMKLELPTTKSTEVTRVENLILHVSREGEIFLNEKQLAIDSVKTYLIIALAQSEEKTLILKADKEATHGLVVQLMDIAKQNGFKKIVIGTRVDEQTP